MKKRFRLCPFRFQELSRSIRVVEAAARARLPLNNPHIRRDAMTSTTDKIKGAANEAVGNVKQAAGKAVGNDRLRAEGIVQERKGEAQQAVGKAKDAVKKVIDKV